MAKFDALDVLDRFDALDALDTFSSPISPKRQICQATRKMGRILPDLSRFFCLTVVSSNVKRLTNTEVVMATAEQVTNAIVRYQDARPELRAAFHASATASALELVNERDALVKRLETRWRWCDEHQGHPALIEREDAVLIDLATYQAMEDALRFAADALFGVAA